MLTITVPMQITGLPRSAGFASLGYAKGYKASMPTAFILLLCVSCAVLSSWQAGNSLSEMHVRDSAAVAASLHTALHQKMCQVLRLVICHGRDSRAQAGALL